MAGPKTQEITREYVQAPRGSEVVRVPLANITHFTFADKYASAHTTSGELLLNISLGELEEIYGALVVRTHRSSIAVKARLISMKSDPVKNGGWAVVESIMGGPLAQTTIRVSRRQKGYVRRALAERAPCA